VDLNQTCEKEHQIQTDPKVFNLSDRILNKTEINLLSKGLKYTPTPSMNNQQLRIDLKEYTRRLKLREFFNEDSETDEVPSQTNEQEPEDLVRNKSRFIPKRGKNRTLDVVCDTIENIQLPKALNNHKSNLSREEEKALKDLSNDDSIIIKEADKGGGVVVMNKHFYEQKILHMLHDTQYYRDTDKNHQKKTLGKIKQLVNGPLSGNITNKEKYYLTNFDAHESKFYGLPKVHKSSEIKNAIANQKSEYICCIDPVDLTFQPIVGGPNSSTQRLSHLLDILLQPYSKIVPSFIRDDLDFLRHLPDKIPQHTKLVSFDVVSLYTNIALNLGIEAVKFWIDQHHHLLNDRFERDFVLQGLKVILENNIFAFG
jgi:hypothetical protein